MDIQDSQPANFTAKQDPFDASPLTFPLLLPLACPYLCQWPSWPELPSGLVFQ
jgi:hypothetical protein